MNEDKKRVIDQILRDFTDVEKTKKRRHKHSVSLPNCDSPRSRFFKKDGNKPERGDKITYMRVFKKYVDGQKVKRNASDQKSQDISD
jgi:hypothetical protein